MCIFAVLLALPGASDAGVPLTLPGDLTPTAWVYLPVVYKQGCPTTSSNQYTAGTAYQYDDDNPVRLAYNHADKNLALRGYVLNTSPYIRRELVDYGTDDLKAPQFATLFNPPRVPPLVNFYQVHHWQWAPSPNPGHRAEPIASPPVTALGLQTTPGETLRVPESGYDIGGGMEVIVLFADADSIALRYTREDSSGSPGYTLHLDRICTDPNLLALYNALDAPNGPRYVYKPPTHRPYWYDLPNLYAGQPLGVARGYEVVIAVTDSGTFMDPRSCNDWWLTRPGYTGTCPPHE